MREIETSRLIRLREVERLTGLSKSSLYRLEATHEFPPRVKLTIRSSAWKSDEVMAWIASRPRADASNQCAA